MVKKSLLALKVIEQVKFESRTAFGSNSQHCILSSQNLMLCLSCM